MKVRDYTPQLWFLFEDDEALYFEANCSHGAVGYDFMIQLSPGEVAEYKAKGTGFLDSLAQEIQDSAPGVIGTKSGYKDREVSMASREKAREAFHCWKSENNDL
jgi:hypothetical protein